MSETETLDYAAPERSAAPLGIGMRTRLSLMMLFQYAAWGAWWVVIGKYMFAINFTGAQVGRVFATTAIASIISPLIFGQIADRWVPTQHLLVVLHLLGAGALYLISRFQDFTAFYACVLAWALLYIPTISLTNSLSFHHVPDAARHFPTIRVFGTIGWIVAGLALWLFALDEESTQPILLAAAISAVLGLFCLTLPHTPPTGKPGDTLPPLRAIGMLGDGRFALFIVVSFIMAIVLAGYFAFAAIYLGHPPRNIANAAGIMTIGQFAEMLLLPFLPFFLKYLGMKRTLLIGMAAWGLRYAIFSLGQPTWLVIASLALHGVCFDFFFVAAYIHVDNQAAKDIRASAQALFNFVTMGVGMYIGSVVFGRLVDTFTDVNKVINWQTVWGIPALGVVICVAIFVAGFREPRNETAPQESP